MSHKPTERVLGILSLLAAHPEGLSLTQITAFLSIPKSTISPILQEMTQQKFIQMQPGANLYTIGIASYCIGTAYEYDKTLLPYIKSIMQKITKEINEMCQVGILDGPDVLYILKEDTAANQTIKIISYVGKRLPAYCTALGKALLYDATLDELKQLYPNPFIKETVNTLENVQAFYDQLQTIKQTQIATEYEEVTYQLCCFAVPIILANSRRYAMSISMPLFRATEEKRALAKKLLLEAKAAIEAFDISLLPQ